MRSITLMPVSRTEGVVSCSSNGGGERCALYLIWRPGRVSSRREMAPSDRVAATARCASGIVERMTRGFFAARRVRDFVVTAADRVAWAPYVLLAISRPPGHMGLTISSDLACAPYLVMTARIDGVTFGTIFAICTRSRVGCRRHADGLPSVVRRVP